MLPVVVNVEGVSLRDARERQNRRLYIIEKNMSLQASCNPETWHGPHWTPRRARHSFASPGSRGLAVPAQEYWSFPVCKCRQWLARLEWLDVNAKCSLQDEVIVRALPTISHQPIPFDFITSRHLTLTPHDGVRHTADANR